MHAIMLIALLGACRKDKPQDTGTDPQNDDTGTQTATSCATTFTYTPATEDLDGVYIAGEFNDWDPQANPMQAQGDGSYSVTLDLAPGPWPYKFVEYAEWSYGGYEGWVCDPSAQLIHCDDGYTDPSDTSWRHDCAPSSDTACNSMVVVPECGVPQVTVQSVHVDRSNLGLSVSATASGAASGEATLDGEPLSGAFDGTTFTVDLSGLSPTRHTVRLTVFDDQGDVADQAYIPFWLDVNDPGDEAWRRGGMYFAFLDRLANGDPSLDGTEGATDTYGDNAIGDYMGGDLRGLIELLPYLDDLGITTIWVSNLQDNAQGAWTGDCESTVAGYHAYWPTQPRSMEEHFGDGDALHQLVDEAHARNMRVVMDWVANHVHEDHPYAAHADWFNDYLPCKEGDDTSGFDNYPETCWFASYLPDIDYTNPEPLDQMVDDALWWATTYELDGFRVDAAKHMTHAVVWNLEARVRDEIEHRDAGGDEQFWTVGETFDGYDRIAAYMSSDNGDGTETLQLDGQFDFPMYYSVRDVFASQTGSMADLDAAIRAASAAYGTSLMSNFLGNHDVVRFTTAASEGDIGSCWSDTDIATARFTSDDNVYDRLRLAWTFLFTQPAPPLVYYGDELGMPGYSDPDNRQPMWWVTGDLSGGAVSSVDDVAARVGAGSAAVVEQVGALGRARRDHPAFWRGTQVEWWAEYPSVWAYARVDDQTGDQVLVILNRSWDDRSFTNGLAFANLSEGTWTDVLSGASYTSSGDSITIDVGAYQSRVLVHELRGP